MTILTDKPEVDRIDVALHVEELVEIYNTKPKKVIGIDWLDVCILDTIASVYIYTLGW